MFQIAGKNVGSCWVVARSQNLPTPDTDQLYLVSVWGGQSTGIGQTPLPPPPTKIITHTRRSKKKKAISAGNHPCNQFLFFLIFLAPDFLAKTSGQCSACWWFKTIQLAIQAFYVLSRGHTCAHTYYVSLVWSDLPMRVFYVLSRGHICVLFFISLVRSSNMQAFYDLSRGHTCVALMWCITFSRSRWHGSLYVMLSINISMFVSLICFIFILFEN